MSHFGEGFPAGRRARLAAGTAPPGQILSGDVFVLPPGVGVSTLALAAVAGFLAFAGFESAGSLGEESLVPTRMIPRAIITAVAFGAVFYMACIVAQTLGFGTDAAGVSVFQDSQAPLGELAEGGFVQALDLRQRVEQELRFDSRLHGLQSRFKRLPRESCTLELRLVQRGHPA